MAGSVENTASVRPLSPCISICALAANGYCSGCLRTGDEIAAWMRMSPTEQWALMRELAGRRASRTQAAEQRS